MSGWPILRYGIVPALIVGAGLAFAVATAGPPRLPGGLPTDAPPPAVAEPLPFDHSGHAWVFKKEGLSCVHCHPIGARTESGPAGPVPPLRRSCHGCHLHELRGAPRRAEATCSGCHPNRRELLPSSHGLGWIDAHGPEARSLGNECASCHDKAGCVACHEGRGAMTRSPHGPGFRSVHGVEARVDPASCSSCHTEDSCSSCHTTGVVPW